MPWCPICKSEFREGVTNCSDCNVELVDKLEQVKDKQDYDKEAYLTSVKGGIEASVLEALLTSNNIPVLKKYKESGGFLSIYMGDTNSGIDLYVPSKLLEEAKSIIDKDSVIPDDEYSESIQEEEAFKNESQKIQKRRSFRAWFILLFSMLGMIMVIIYIILMIMEKL